MKKIISLTLAGVMAIAMSVSSFASSNDIQMHLSEQAPVENAASVVDGVAPTLHSSRKSTAEAGLPFHLVAIKNCLYMSILTRSLLLPPVVGLTWMLKIFYPVNR